MSTNPFLSNNDLREDFEVEKSEESVCEEAQRLVRGDRQEHYGDPTDNFRRIAELWTAYLGRDLSKPIDVQDVCAMMILLKQARMRTGGCYHRDSAVDTCGYALLQEILDDRA